MTDRTRSPADGAGGRPPLRRLLAEFGLERFAGKDHLTGLRGGRDWVAARLSPPGGTPVELRGALADAWLITPDEHKITSLAEGYRDARPVAPAELRLLPHAIRFGIAFVGAVHFRQGLLEGHAGPGMDARLARLRNRLAASEEIAEIAAGTLSAG